MTMNRWLLNTLTLTACAVSFLFLAHGAMADKPTLAQAPYMGWSSWSYYQAKVTEAAVKSQADVVADKLKSYGYVYIKVDDTWQQGFDDHGYWKANPETFPDGIKSLADYVHKKGLKFGIYLVPGIPKALYDLNPQIAGTTVHIADITDITRAGSTKRNTYKIDYSKPGATEYIQGYANLLASWGVDFIKMDFVGPGGGNNPADNRDDLRQWHAAILNTKRPIWVELSNKLSIGAIADWKATSNGWRISNDIERYHSPFLTSWSRAALRFDQAPLWAKLGGPGGWNDFDSLEIGNGASDGLTLDERRTIMTLWAINCAPLSLGSDLTKLDADDYALLTNKEVIAVDQAGHIATPLSQATPQQVWSVQNPDGSWTVAVFNLGTTEASVTVKWLDLYATVHTLYAVSRTFAVRDLWSHANLGSTETFTTTLAPHACRLLRVLPDMSR